MSTLNEKFKEKILSFLGDSMKEQNAVECEKIADDYAICFAEWIVKNCNHSKLKFLDYKQLLEVFKKEKDYTALLQPVGTKEEPKQHSKVLSENGNELFFDEQGNLFKQEVERGITITNVGEQESKRFKNMEKLTEVEWSKFKKAPFKHKVESLSTEEVLANRSNAYEFIDFDKQETLEEVINKYPLINQRIGFKEGAKWQQERMYNEEEVLRLLVKREIFLELYDMANEYKDANEWFKKFKK